MPKTSFSTHHTKVVVPEILQIPGVVDSVVRLHHALSFAVLLSGGKGSSVSRDGETLLDRGDALS